MKNFLSSADQSLKNILEQGEAEALLDSSYQGVSNKDESILETKGYKVYRGKVRDCVIKDSKIYMVHSDRLSAYDAFINLVPFRIFSCSYQ